MVSRVLIIDDEEGMCWALERALGQEGYEVTSVTSWLEGLFRIRTEKFDLVLLDIRMPDMDALAVLGRIQNLKPMLPVLIMTGYNTLPVAVEAIQKGARGYLIKPFSVSNLLLVVKKALAADFRPLESRAM